mmetsp:Transcript_22302/g.56541  ORF Transcript_22302/g.56541 Transcript_22302/m.56541 type:complete len:243 (+) Transcript_22302:507-1235(+)
MTAQTAKRVSALSSSKAERRTGSAVEIPSRSSAGVAGHGSRQISARKHNAAARRTCCAARPARQTRFGTRSALTTCCAHSAKSGWAQKSRSESSLLITPRAVRRNGGSREGSSSAAKTGKTERSCSAAKPPSTCCKSACITCHSCEPTVHAAKGNGAFSSRLEKEFEIDAAGSSSTTRDAAEGSMRTSAIASVVAAAPVPPMGVALTSCSQRRAPNLRCIAAPPCTAHAKASGPSRMEIARV